MTDELKKAELAAHAYDGLGAPMSAYRPHIAELRRQVLDPMFAATRESQGQPVDAEPRACKHNWLAHVPVGQMQTASYICGFCGEQKPAAQEPVKAALRAYAEASKDTHCPICGGRESCDHTVRERLLAALIPPSRAGKAVDDNPLTPMSGFLVFLKDMRFTGSWDLPTLDRAIEVGETIAAQSLAVPQAGAPTGEITGLIERLGIKAAMIEMGEKIAWGSDSALMREAAAALPSLSAKLAEVEATIQRRTFKLFNAEDRLTASEAEATDLRRKLEEVRKALGRLDRLTRFELADNATREPWKSALEQAARALSSDGADHG